MKFGSFELNPNTRELFNNGEKIPVQNKSFDLLLYLIEHRDRAVSKDELLDKLWDGRVVTESVLSHAATKLRTALNDNKGKGQIIRTVYGYGLQFVAKIQENNNPSKTDEAPAQKPTKPYLPLLITAIFVIGLVITFLSLQRTSKKTDDEALPENRPEIPKLSFISQRNDRPEEEWLLKGLTLYMNQITALSDNSMILPFTESAELSDKFNDFYSISNVVNTTREGEQLQLDFRHNKISKSSLEIPLKDLAESINNINHWVCDNILTDNSGCNESMDSLASNDSYVIESYLRGKSAMMDSLPKNAIVFFQACLKQQDNFMLARLSLAQAYFEISEYDKSISQAQLIIQTAKNELIRQQAQIILATTYHRQSKYQLAETVLNEIIHSQHSNSGLRAQALLKLAQIIMDTGNLEEAYKTAEESKIVLDQLKLPVLVARAYDVMGSIKMTTGELKESQKLLTESLRIYEYLEYDIGIEKILSPLGLVMQSQGLLEASLEYGKQRQKIAEKMGDPINIAGSHLHLANLLLEMGDYDTAMEHANKMWDIVIEQDEPQAILMAYFIAGEVARAQGKYELSLKKYKQALDIANEQKILFRQVQVSCTVGITALDGGLNEEAEHYLTECQSLSENSEYELFKVVSKLYLAQLYEEQNKINLSISTLNDALKESVSLENDHLTYEILVELFYHSLETDLKQAESYLQSIPEGYKDSFHFLVFQAELSTRRQQWTDALQYLLEAKTKAKDNWTTENENFLLEIKSELGHEQ